MYKTIGIGIAALALAGILVFAAHGHRSGGSTVDAITLDTKTAQEVHWDKPTTDAEWAVDTENEQIADRSTDVLQEMKASQTEKLAAEKTEFKRYDQCPQCIYWDYYQDFSKRPDMDDAAAQAQAQASADTDTAQRQWEIEKIEQSIERIDNELRLRAEGFVVTDDEKAAAAGPASVGATGKIIRHIIDH